MHLARALTRRLATPSTSQIAQFCSCTPVAGVGFLSRNRNPNTVKIVKKTGKKAVLNKAFPRTELHLALCNVTPIASRPVLINEDSCRDVVRAWGVDKMEDVTIVEPYAGPGGITRALLELPNVRKVICIEQAWRYLPHLESLKEKHGDRIEIVSADPFAWEAYSTITERGYLDHVQKLPWEQRNGKLFMVSTLPNHRHGEQIFVQWMNCISGRMWLYQYGRFDMGILAAKTWWTKLTAPVSTPHHHKLAVLMEASVKISPAEMMAGFDPPDLHFHRPKADDANFAAVLVEPLAVALVKDVEALEYCARNMFVTKGHPWRRALAALAPGASNLLPKIESYPAMNRDPDWAVNDLSIKEWAIISHVFMAWPFRPKVLFDDGGFDTLNEPN